MKQKRRSAAKNIEVSPIDLASLHLLQVHISGSRCMPTAATKIFLDVKETLKIELIRLLFQGKNDRVQPRRLEYI